MKKQFLFSLFIFNVLFVCGQEIIPLKDALSLKECKVSEYASSIEYIPLEDSEECLLTQDLHVIVASQYIFVLDYKENRTCRFDKTGKFMNFIGKRGQGPGEYNRLFGIYIDDATQECFLLEPFSNRINVYDYNGTFKRNIHVKCAPDRMMKLGDNYVLNHTLMNVNKYELTLINSEGKTIKQSNRESNKQVGMSFWSPFFYMSGNNVFYKNYLSEYIYRVDNDLKRKKAYWIDLGNKAINSEENQYDLKRGDLSRNNIIVETLSAYKNLLFIPYAYNKGRFFVIYNKVTKKIFTPGSNGKSGFVDDLTNGPHVQVPYSTYLITSLQENQLVSVIHMTDIADESFPDGKFKQVLDEYQLNEDSNPIIRIVNLK